ncbi:MAG: hypothetical protein KatS3mg118_0732 [Paracoccaceae bacterium]|nr:MAG: hypothetical protein KatS3mg118_0732 [Paracoccaceae bacterium]
MDRHHEPDRAQAGSDVGALRATAEPSGDGTYAVSGQKIFISWGDHDMAQNICHLVLARLPGAAPGTRGISLFLVPKIIFDAEGRLGAANSVRAIGLEHKLGLHGSPTCVMEYDRATGWLIGPEHGGMACMFTMMNAARLAVGVEGVASAEAALQAALAHARERRQGRTPRGDGRGPIAEHADVRRMIAQMRARTSAARAICLDCALSLDMARAAANAEERARWTARAALLTPIAKAFGTETGCEVADLAIQIHGGMGYVEETGVAQFWRDVRVTTIYEGTNGIQAMDLVGRKLSDGGAAARALIAAMRAGAGSPLARALDALDRATGWMLSAEPTDRNAGAVPYLRAFALCLGVHYLHAAARARPAEPARAALARIGEERLLPQVAALCAEACAGAGSLYAEEAEPLFA